ncbi:MAG: tRNA (N6-isopentenyl adenosine(37)-C2)-methylthiotransferase MiaB [Rickettsiales bacterium]|nr:tRNA (N6-isopentenyl adenosine(37)-C2)-methylthiotransferase MiaB [Rickettsiales bacterium]|tara:strand:- start:18692 stop:20056 length:1365 start_codon:yes stop_codon:yes gene_type:complete
MTQKRLFIKTYGCQMNVYDSDKMADVLRPHGYELANTPENSDMIILNTCHIREKAAEKVFSELGRLKVFKDLKKQNGQHMIIAVAGCVAQAEGAEIIRRAPYVDIVLGPQTYHRLPEMIERAERNSVRPKGKKREKIVEVDFPHESKFDEIALPEVIESTTAFLTIQEGCDKFCTFCCVPYTRGAEFSRSVQEVLSEAKHLVKAGVREITLLGQNVTAYHGVAPNGKGEWTMAQLIQEIATIDGLDRIRYTTSHPRDMTKELIQVHGSCEKLMPYLHLPVQSGSDYILKTMNRQHTRERYFEIIEELRAARPDLSLSSDFIVGFPGEKDVDFQQTMDLVERVTYAQAYSFKFSPRPGTPASVYPDSVPEHVKDERLAALKALLRDQQTAFNQSKIGQTMPVLIERKGRHKDQFVGRSPYLQGVHITNPALEIGQIYDVTITDSTLNSLTAMYNN